MVVVEGKEIYNEDLSQTLEIFSEKAASKSDYMIERPKRILLYLFASIECARGFETLSTRKEFRNKKRGYCSGIHSRNWIVKEHHTRSGKRGLQMKHEDT